MSGYLIVTGHDYRSARKANLHFIAAELAKRGETRMFSLGFSPLSNLRGRDPRRGLERVSNVVGHEQGVSCFLWRTPLHPFNPKVERLQKLSARLYDLYRRARPVVLQRWAYDADTILVESGLGALFLADLRRWNPRAKIIYVASDDLKTLDCDPCLQQALDRALPLLDAVILPSPLLRAAFPGCARLYHVPHGIDPALGRIASVSPYGEGVHAVSVGSMLFDPGFFAIASEAFPEVTFHVIGAGTPSSALPRSVRVYGEMPFSETAAYQQHARFGIAPYRDAAAPYYLADTSMKLMQYAYLGLPAVCPDFAVGAGGQLRFGYRPGDRASIMAAITAAMSAPHEPRGRFLDWSEVTDRILEPTNFADTQLADGD